MIPPSLESLRTPANGQILLLKEPLSKAAVGAAFEAAAISQSQRSILKLVRELRAAARGDFWASLVCFPITQPPSFFPNSALSELTYGFLLLLEVEIGGKWFLGLFKKNCASLNEWLETRAEHLPRTKLTNAFGDGKRINRLNLQRMTVSQHELRGSSYEAADLRTSLPLMAAGRCAIRSVRFDVENHGSIAVTVSTSRVQRSGGRQTVDDLADLVRMVASETLAAKPNGFLGGFAKAVPLRELPSNAEPNSILFDWSQLLDNDDAELRRSPLIKGQLGKEVRKRLLTRLLGESVPLFSDGAAWEFRKERRQQLGTLVATTSKYVVRKLLKERLTVHDVGSKIAIPLHKWARDHDAYSITFTEPEFFFGNGALYHRAKFGSEIDWVRRCLQTDASLVSATSEKGNPQKSDSAFPRGSIFRAVEDSIYRQREWLCCADLGDEWADYFCIRNDKLIFVHCKGGSQTTGASSFQEVVGQGLKNLGRIQSTPDDFRVKLAATKKNRFWAGSKIARLRGTKRKWGAFETAIDNLLIDPDAGREVHLVVTMLSKTAFEAAALNKPPSPHFIQLVWLLAAFLSSCREMGARPVIVCKP